MNGIAYSDAVGPENDWEIAEETAAADLVVAAWGGRSRVRRDYYDRRAEEVVDLVGADGLVHVGTRTKDGYPRHPLFWRDSFQLGAW